MKIAKEGETGIARYDMCMRLFEYVGDGMWIPTTCQKCKEKRQAQIAVFLVTIQSEGAE